MPTPLFRWSVAKGGHVLVNGNTAIWRRPDAPADRTTYPLRDAPELFLRFADLAESPDAASLLAFADTHGLLLNEGPEPLGDGGGDDRPEHLGGWRSAAWRMAQAARLLRSIRIRDRRVGEWVRYAQEGARVPTLRLTGDRGEERITLRGELRELADPTRPLRNARLALQVLVNKHLDEHASPRLLLDSATDRHVVELVPRTLLGALWVQMAQAVESEAQPSRCAHCRRWNPPGRTDRLTCSGACRKALSRSGRARAQRRHRRRT